MARQVVDVSCDLASRGRLVLETPVEQLPKACSTGAPFDQQSTTERASPASLVSLYLLFMSLAVWARAATVSSRPMR